MFAQNTEKKYKNIFSVCNFGNTRVHGHIFNGTAYSGYDISYFYLNYEKHELLVIFFKRVKSKSATLPRPFSKLMSP